MKKFQDIYVIDYALADLYKIYYQFNTQYCLRTIPKKFYIKQKEKYEFQINSCLLDERMVWQKIFRQHLNIEHEMNLLEKKLNLNVGVIFFEEELNPFYRIYYYLYYCDFIQKMNNLSASSIASAKERYNFYEKVFFYKFIQKIIAVCDTNSYFNSQAVLAMSLYRNIFYTFSFCDTNESILNVENFEKSIMKKSNLSWEEYKIYKNMVVKDYLEDLLRDLNTLPIEEFKFYLEDFSLLVYLNTLLSLLMNATIVEEIINNIILDEEKRELLKLTIKTFFPETVRFHLVK